MVIYKWNICAPLLAHHFKTSNKFRHDYWHCWGYLLPHMLMEITPHFWEHKALIDARNSSEHKQTYAERVPESHLVAVSVWKCGSGCQAGTERRMFASLGCVSIPHVFAIIEMTNIRRDHSHSPVSVQVCPLCDAVWCQSAQILLVAAHPLFCFFCL